MSRIGKQPITIPEGVTITDNKPTLTIKGSKGELKRDYPAEVSFRQKDGQLMVERVDDGRRARSCHGLFRSLVANAIAGVVEGFSKQLEIKGIGYRVKTEGSTLVLNVGFSHPVNFQIPEDIDITVAKNKITVAGIDKQRVGQIAAEIRSIKKPEPYKGKGIRYVDEVVRRKAGKGAKVA